MTIKLYVDDAIAATLLDAMKDGLKTSVALNVCTKDGTMRAFPLAITSIDIARPLTRERYYAESCRVSLEVMHLAPLKS